MVCCDRCRSRTLAVACVTTANERIYVLYPMKIELQKIELSFGDKPPLLQDLDFMLDAGDFALIHGPSGCGKSSLLRVLNRLQEPSAGRILIDGRPAGEYEVTQLRRRMGFVQQTPVMITGNSMNAITIALERMFTELRRERPRIELALSLGGTYQEATADILRACIRAGMIPSINALMTVGLVSLPGMMTGQILAGADPMTSIKYQIIVMLMLVASTAIGSIIVVHVVRRMCFSKAQQMVVH